MSTYLIFGVETRQKKLVKSNILRAKFHDNIWKVVIKRDVQNITMSVSADILSSYSFLLLFVAAVAPRDVPLIAFLLPNLLLMLSLLSSGSSPSTSECSYCHHCGTTYKKTQTTQVVRLQLVSDHQFIIKSSILRFQTCDRAQFHDFFSQLL